MNDKKKIQITTAVAKELPDSSQYKNLAINHLLFRWWYTGRTGTTLRLTEEGRLAFADANIEHFDFPIDTSKIKNTSGKEYTLKLGKKIKCPFYIGLKTQSTKSAYIRVYDSKVAMMITLYGNFNEYLDHKIYE